MSEWAPKRFWTSSDVVRVDKAHAVHLDGRPIRTPAGRPLHLPTQKLATAIAAEWDAQTDVVDPSKMPFTRMANSALDKVAIQRAEVIGYLAEYGGTDLLCYRAEGPDALVKGQAAAWDPVLDWAKAQLNAELAVTRGIMPIAQPPQAIAALSQEMETMSVFQLASFHDLVSLTTSLILGYAVARGAFDPGDIWQISRIDEDYQISQWGRDDEADRVAALKRDAFIDAATFFRLSGVGG